MSTAKRGATERRLSWQGKVALLAALQTGCSIVYSEQSTPVRSVPADTEVLPEPPSDVFYLAVKGARIPQRTRDGRSWDKGAGSAPDAYAILFIDHVEVLRTPVVSDSFEPKWPDAKAANYRILPTTSVRLELWDDNVLVAHPVCSQVLEDLADASSVGGLSVSCDSGASVDVTVEPAKPQLGIGLYYERRGDGAQVTRVVAASSAGRAGLRPGDKLVSVRGRPVAQLTAGEFESILNSNNKGGLAVEIRGKDGEIRRVELREEAMYPVYGEDVAR